MRRRFGARWLGLALAVLVVACGGGGGSIVAEPDEIAVTAQPSERSVARTRIVRLDGLPDVALYGRATPAGNGIERVDLAYDSSDDSVRLQVTFVAPAGLSPGTYRGRVSVSICTDAACATHVRGSPFALDTVYTVAHTVPAAAAWPLATLAARWPLAHDVVDAEYSSGLDRLVLVSNLPRPALILIDPYSGNALSMPLPQPATAVSVSPDGWSAAVGHDAAVTHVDLRTVGSPGGATSRRLSPPELVGDLVLDGNGVVHVLLLTGTSSGMMSIDVATGAVQPVGGPPPRSRARLHPSRGDALYVAKQGVLFEDLERYDVVAGVARWVAGQRGVGVEEACGDLWFGVDGASAITPCGHVFWLSPDPVIDMTHRARLPLGTGGATGFRIVGGHSRDASRELALLEQSAYECEPFHVTSIGCHAHLALFDGDTLLARSRYRLPTASVGGAALAQRGQFVFHRNDGELVLVLKTVPAADPLQAHAIAVVAR